MFPAIVFPKKSLNSPRIGGSFDSLILFLSERVRYLFLSFTCSEYNLDERPKKTITLAAVTINNLLFIKLTFLTLSLRLNI